jgi:hypothetical protein
MNAGAAVVLLASMLPVAALRTVPEIRLSDRTVRVSDVANLSGADSRGLRRLSRRPIARLPHDRESITLSRSTLADLLRRAVPSLRILPETTGAVRLRAPIAPPVVASSCLALSHAVPVGSPLSREDAVPVACDSSRRIASVRFDRSDTRIRAVSDLAKGSYLGRTFLPTERGVMAGDRLTLRSAVGPVSIERAVVALQAGRSGRRLFVRDQDGQTIAAPLSNLEEVR